MEDDFDPSVHLIPLAPNTRIPVMSGEDWKGKGTLVAVAADGRISSFPTDPKVFSQRIHDRLKQRFPGGKDTSGNKVAQYVGVGVMYGEPSEEGALVFEVWGWQERFGELDYLYFTLHSLLGRTVGDEHWKAVEKELSGEPVKGWINALIHFFKRKIAWADYVRESSDSVLDSSSRVPKQVPRLAKCPFCRSTSSHVLEEAGYRRCSKCHSVLPRYVLGDD